MLMGFSKKSISILIILGMQFSFATAQDLPKVYWGGVSLVEAASSSTESVAAALFRCPQMPCAIQLEAADQIVKKAKYEKIDVIFGKLAANETLGYILTPVLSSELVMEADHGDLGYSYTYIIFGSLMIIEVDPNESSYIYSLPYIFQVEDWPGKKISKEAQDAFLSDIYLNKKREYNYFQEMAAAASSLMEVRVAFPKYAQVNSIQFSDEVLEVLNQTGTTDAWRRRVTNFFEARLAAEIESPLLPAGFGEGTIDVVFADASRRIKLPPPFYDLKLDVQRFVRQDFPDQGAICFMVKTNVKISADNEDMFNLDFTRKKDSCIDVPKGSKRLDKEFFPASLFSQLFRIANAFNGKPDANYLKRNVKDAAAAKTALKSAHNLLLPE
jgi:hypothetical protein